MTRKTSVWVGALVVLWIVVTPCWAQNVGNLDRDGILDRFFRGMKEEGGRKSLNNIKGWFKPEQSSGDFLALKIDEMLLKFGSFDEQEFLGMRELGKSGRYVEAAYVSYHKLGPVIWEITAYRHGDAWLVLTMKFSTEEVLQKSTKYGKDDVP